MKKFILTLTDKERIVRDEWKIAVLEPGQPELIEEHDFVYLWSEVKKHRPFDMDIESRVLQRLSQLV